MKYINLILSALAICACTEQKPADFVDPLIGSGFHGHVFVGANVPFGFIQAGPTNVTQGWDWCSGYHESDSTVIGFSHTHLSGTGCGDLLDITIMPVVGKDLAYARGRKDDPSTGLWGDGDLTNPKNLSNAVQGAYHWWAVFFYEGRTIPYAQAAAAQVLRTQNPLGGFGQGVHNPEDPWQSSACEDIDSLDPLCRMLARGEIKGEEVRKSIRRGRRRVAENRMPDGGMVFYRGRPFEYGHPELYGAADRGAMFPTWFRTLTLAVCDTALGDDTDFAFVHCPGYQFPIETEKNTDRS